MPHIVRPFYKHKKQMREDLIAGKTIHFDDPSIFAPHSMCSSTMKPGDSCTVTNHPKRSWFASVRKTADGWEVK